MQDRRVVRMNEITEIFDVLKVLANGVTSLTILGGGIVILFKPLRKKAADWVAKQTNTAK